MWKYAGVVLIGCLFGVLETTFFTLLPSPWLDVRPIIPLLTFGIVIEFPMWSIWTFGVSSAFMLDVFSLNPTFTLLRMMLLLFVCIPCAKHWTTNRSYYAAVVLTSFARLFDVAGNAVATYAFQPFALEKRSDFFVHWSFTTMLSDVCLLSLLFMLHGIFSKTFLRRQRRKHMV